MKATVLISDAEVREAVRQWAEAHKAVTYEDVK